MPQNKRITVYILLVILLAVIGFAYGVREQGIFACQAISANSNEYLGLCNVPNYGDYDHGAFWFELEPHAINSVKRAKVLFVGNSRMQFGMSSDKLDNWFSSQNINYYLLGFSHTENAYFLTPLMKKLNVSPELLVVNVDSFFDERLTGPANTVMNKSDSSNRYHQKRLWQSIHIKLCGVIKQLCGNSSSYVRARENGSWTFSGKDFLASAESKGKPVAYNKTTNTPLSPEHINNAELFIENTNVPRQCIVLTIVPNTSTELGQAKLLAKNLGLPLVSPTIDNLVTFDGSHLDPPSAATWSGRFVKMLQPYVEDCVTKAVN